MRFGMRKHLLSLLAAISLSSPSAMVLADCERTGISAPVTQPAASADVDCLLFPAQLSDPEQWTVVDTRDSGAHDALRAAGSLNLSSARLRASTVLRQRERVLLLGDGASDGELVRLCRRLKADGNGFAGLAVLAGGVQGWRQAGGELEGNLAAGEQLVSISPEAFHAGHGDFYWQVFTTVDDSGVFEDLAALVPVHQVSAHDSEKIERFLAAHLDARALLVMDDHQVPASLRGRPDVYRLAGGITAYQEFLARHHSMVSYEHRIGKGAPACMR